MNYDSLYQKADAYRAKAVDRLSPVYSSAKVGCTQVWDRISAILTQYLLSEVCILKILLISFGILVGATFADFFKKHRMAVIVVFLTAAALFVYKAIQLLADIEDESDVF